MPAAGVVEFITSFGGDSDNEGAVHGPALPPPQIHKRISSSSRYVLTLSVMGRMFYSLEIFNFP